MRKLTLICMSLSICLCLPVNELWANESQLAGTMELIVPKSPQQMADPDAEAVKKWYSKGEPQGKKGELWEQGASIQDINRRRVLVKNNTNQTTGLDTRAGIEVQLRNLSEYERGANSEPITFADGRIRGESSVEKATWRPAITEPVKIDEPILASQHNVVGAYADMVDDDDFHLSAGPEIHLPDAMSSPLGEGERPDSSELGMGMKLMWGF